MSVIKMVTDDISKAAVRYAKENGCVPSDILFIIQFAEYDGGVMPIYTVRKTVCVNGHETDEAISEVIDLQQLLGIKIDFLGKCAMVDNWLLQRAQTIVQSTGSDDIFIVITNDPILFKVFLNGVETVKSLDFNYNARAALYRYSAELNVPVEDVSILIEKIADNLFYKVNIKYLPITELDRHKYFSIAEIMDIKFEFIDNEAENINDYILKKMESLDVEKPVFLIEKSKTDESIITHAYNGSQYLERLKI